MPKKFNFIKVLFPIILASIALFLCFKNYTPGTYLIGWDSMHSEFNFPLNVGRMLSHVWGSEMGVGAISAHSDMSDLPRIVILWLTSFVLPVSLIRYFFIFSCLILGPLGMYFFLKYIFQIKKDSLFLYPAVFLGALFYLMNLGTLQNFYVPLEMFTIAFAGIPWLFLTGLKYLREGKKKNLLLFSTVVILISPMSYAATQAYAIYLGIFMFLFVFSLISSGKKLKLKRFFLLGIVTLLLNLYWILPNIYSIVQQSETISNANINRLFSQESFLRNADYGNLENILIQKSFLFSWRNFDFGSGTFNDLLGSWNNHLSSSYVLYGGYGLGFMAVFGFLISLIKREKIGISFTLPLFLCLFFLININHPTGIFYKYLYDHFGIFREAFRTPFTKFSVLFEFILSFYFGYFVYQIFSFKTRHLKFFITSVKVLFMTGVVGALVYFSLPVFGGELIGKNVRVKFPDEYTQLFSWFDNHSEGRIALMSEPGKFGWEYRSWGYEGSGFLTYGIKNPVLYRDFDRWNSSNEDFYNQSSFSLYANDDQGFINTLKKYNVKYLLLDESIINPGGSSDVLKIPEIKQIMDKYGMENVASFGFLSVYDTGFEVSEVFSPRSYSRINADLSYTSKDPFYSKIGDYVAGGDFNYPFVNLNERSGVKMDLWEDEIEFTNIQSGLTAKADILGTNKIDLSINQGFDEGYNCDLKNLGEVSKQITKTGVSYKATGGGAECDFIGIPNMEYQKAYVLHLTGQNLEGRSLKIYLFDSFSQTPYLEEILPAGSFDKTYFIYPRDIKGNGYVMNLETRSFGRIASENLISKVEFYEVSYKEPTLQNVDGIKNNLEIKSVKKYGTWGYAVEAFGKGLVALGQGYEKGWVAFEIIDNKLKFLNHTKVNSWANGWIVPGTGTYYIFFWPQALEWGGIFFGISTLLLLVLKKK